LCFAIGSCGVASPTGSCSCPPASLPFASPPPLSSTAPKSTLPGVDAVYQAAPEQLKESLVLASASATSTYRVALSLSWGLRVVASAGTVEVVNAQGAVRFVLPAPTMYQTPAGGSGAPPARGDFGPVAVSVAQQAGGATVTYTADRSWLGAAGRRFPVTVDPSVNAGSTSSADCTLAQAQPMTNDPWCGYLGSGSEQYDWVGEDSSGYLYGSLVSFAGGFGIAADSQVLGAMLYLNAPVSESMAITVQALREQFTPGAATWDSYDGVHAWATPGGDTAPADPSNASYAATGTLSSSGSSGVAITPLVQSWVDGSNPVRSLLVEASAPAAGALGYFTKAAAGSGQPYIGIYYAPRTGSPRGATIQTTALSDRLTLGVNVANGDLSLQASDLQIAGLGLDETIGRGYNNLTGGGGALGWGPGWGNGVLASPEPTVSAYDPDAVLLNTPDGQSSVWDKTSTGGYIAPAGLDGSLCAAGSQGGCPGLPAGDSYQVTWQNGERWELAPVLLLRQLSS
jgi:hypothetical protein